MPGAQREHVQFRCTIHTKILQLSLYVSPLCEVELRTKHGVTVVVHVGHLSKMSSNIIHHFSGPNMLLYSNVLRITVGSAQTTAAGSITLSTLILALLFARTRCHNFTIFPLSVTRAWYDDSRSQISAPCHYAGWSNRTARNPQD